MKKNDIITLEITAITGEGSGVGRVDGMVVFVPFTAIGDICGVKLLKVTKNCAYGKLMELKTPSPDRVENDCASFGKCGGCSLRHIGYEAEAKIKEQAVIDAFTRIGKLSPAFLPIIKNDRLDGYRNKAQYPIGRNKDGKAICGFYAPNSHRIVECENCRLQPSVFSEIVDFIMDYVREKKVSVYDETQHKGVLRHICVRKGHYSGEINVTLVAKRKTPEFMPLAKALSVKFPAIKGVVLNINSDDTNVIMGDKEIVLAGSAQITDTMCGNQISISPRSFYQVNTPMAERLYGVAKEFAEPDGKVVLDLYCGAGTIGLSMAREAKRVIGVEISEAAVENAKENAVRNGYENAEFFAGDTGKITSDLLERGIKPDVIVIDPARRGCDKLALDNIVAFGAPRVVMISCNPATAARDCAFLAQHGYKTEKVQAVDLFSRTGHVETVCLLSNLNAK